MNSICRALKLTYGLTDNGDNFCATPRLVAYLITKLFPVAQKSSVVCIETKKTLQSYKNITITKLACTTVVSFEDISKMMPYDWFIWKKQTTYITFGYFIDIEFNGQKPFLHLMMDTDYQISIHIDNKVVDPMMLYIPKQISYTLTSVLALFRCMKLIRPCLGYKIKNRQETSFALSSNCTKESCTVEGKSMYILRNLNCMRFLEIKRSPVLTCQKCANFVANKKKGCKNN